MHSDTALRSTRLGTVTLEPHAPVVAGSVGQWTITLTVGSYGIDEGGTIKLAQRFASDWETPQFDQPTASGYCRVSTTGAASLRPYYHAKAHERPWMKCLVIDVYDGSLAPGDVVTIVIGDQSGGGPGARAQTFQESAHEFRILVDPTNASRALPLPTSPIFPVIPGAAATLVCIAPSQARVGEWVDIFVKGEDAWGNPTPAPADLALSWEAGSNLATAGETTGSETRDSGGSDGGRHDDNSHDTGVEFTGGACRAQVAGQGWILARAATANGQLTVRSNPLVFRMESASLNHYWGDLHAQSAGTVGTGDEDEYFTFGRDVARLDFSSHQGNDFQIDDAYWEHLNQTVTRFHRDGEFVVFPGYEWSANSPAGGDRNVFFRREGLPILRSSHWQIPHVPEDSRTPAHPADELFRRLRAHVAREDVILGAHVGGRYADIRRYFDGELGPLVEVLSCWGVFEWMLWDAFDRGAVVGIMCNSDGHKGRPGAEGPGAGEFGIRGGLTCVRAAEKTRAGIWSALQARHCYGTSGPRMLVDFRAQRDGAVVGMMGDVLAGNAWGGDSATGATATLELAAAVVGCGPLESLTLYRGKTPVQTVRPEAFMGNQPSRRVRVGWQGSRIRGRGRRVTWDGEIRVEGVNIVAATPVSFDSHSEGVVEQTADHVRFCSATTGDLDALDFWLDASAGGILRFDSAVVNAEFDLDALSRVGARQTRDCGGLDMQLWVERYPETVEDFSLNLTYPLTEETGAEKKGAETVIETGAESDSPTPYWIKAVQVDGHMAWASPIYV